MLLLVFLKAFALGLMLNSAYVGFLLWLKNKGLEDVQVLLVVAVFTFFSCLIQFGAYFG